LGTRWILDGPPKIIAFGNCFAGGVFFSAINREKTFYHGYLMCKALENKGAYLFNSYNAMS
jgi:hypothetical protein